MYNHVVERETPVGEALHIRDLLHRQVHHQLAVVQIQTEYTRIRREHELPLTSPIHRYHVLEERETPSSQQRAAI